MKPEIIVGAFIHIWRLRRRGAPRALAVKTERGIGVDLCDALGALP